jgi:hypothetical protein
MRKTRQFCGAITFGVAACLMTAPAHASVMYSYFYTAGQANYTVAPGGDVTVPVYLQEVNSDQSANSLLTNEHGLSAAGVNISFLSGSAGLTLTGAAANTGTPSTGFDDPASTGTVNSVTSATITESTDPPPFGTDLTGVVAGSQSNGVSQVFLGTVTFHASSLAGQTTTFTAGVADPSVGSTFTNDNNYDLDNNSDTFNPAGASSLYFSAASTNFDVTTSVPEPTSLSIFGVAGLFLVRRTRRRQRFESPRAGRFWRAL